MRVGDLLNRLAGVRRQWDGSWMACCPAHEDRVASLHITLVDAEPRLLLKCFAGCGFSAILDAAGLTLAELRGDAGPRPAPVARPRPAPRPTPPPKPARVGRVAECWWDIRDHAGRHVASHRRIDYRLADGRTEKAVSWWQPDRRTPGLAGVAGADLPLYGAHRLTGWPLESPIALVEGEKAADALLAAGIPAVGTVCGASVTPGPAALAPLAGRVVTLWPDADDPGRRHMAGIAAALADVAAGVRLLTWRDAARGADAADFLAAWPAAAATALIANAPDWPPPAAPAQPAEAAPPDADVAAQLAAHRAAIADLTRRADSLAEVNRAIIAVLRNPHLGGEKATAVALALHLPDAPARPDGWRKVSLARVAECAGVSPQTASHHLGRLAERGALGKRTARAADETGNWRNELLIRSEGGRVVDILAPVAALGPAPPAEPRERPAPAPAAPAPAPAVAPACACPDCPPDTEQIVVIRRTCTGCGQVRDEPLTPESAARYLPPGVVDPVAPDRRIALAHLRPVPRIPRQEPLWPGVAGDASGGS